MKRLLSTLLLVIPLSGCGAYLSAKRLQPGNAHHTETERYSCHASHGKNLYYRGTLHSMRYVAYGTTHFGVAFIHDADDWWKIPAYPLIYTLLWSEAALSCAAETAPIPYYSYVKLSCLDYDPVREKQELATKWQRERDVRLSLPPERRPRA